MHVTAAKDGVLVRRRLRIFAAAVALVLLCAVCVGGVSGYEFTASTEEQLRTAVAQANNERDYPGADTIVLKDDITLVYDRDTQNGLPSPIEINSDITITNIVGKDIVLKSQYTPVLSTSDFTATNYDKLDSYTLFIINNGATLHIIGNEMGTDLEFTTNHNGRAFDIQSGGSLVIGSLDEATGGVRILNCGYQGAVADKNNGGAIYVRGSGSLTMNSGYLSGNKAGAGGAICVESRSGSFIMAGGQIEDNSATLAARQEWFYKVDGFGGGIWLENGNSMTWTGGEISGNKSPEPDNDSDQDIYCESGSVQRPQNTNGLVVRIVNGQPKYYDFVMDAYAAIVSENLKEDTIYLRGNFPQVPDTIWENGVPYSVLDTVDISKRDIEIKPYGTTSSDSITLDLTNQMFTVSSGSLTLSGNVDATFTVINTRASTSAESDNGGFVSVKGGSLTITDGVSISGVNAVNGGAVYLESGSFTLSGSASITGCTASGNGGAVYVADGTFTVQDSASIDASNDVYLEESELITAKLGYDGTIGKITLPEYIDGTRVVYIGSDKSGYPDQFLMNQEGITNGFNRVLEIGEHYPTYLVLVVPNFDIVIPAKLIVEEEAGGKGVMDIRAKELHIPKKASVVVTFDSKYDFTLAYLRKTTGIVDPTIFLNYELRLDGNLIQEEGEITTFSMDSPNPRTLSVTVLDTPVYAGEYVDTLTFTIQYFSGSTS